MYSIPPILCRRKYWIDKRNTACFSRYNLFCAKVDVQSNFMTRLATKGSHTLSSTAISTLFFYHHNNDRCQPMFLVEIKYIVGISTPKCILVIKSYEKNKGSLSITSDHFRSLLIIFDYF